MTFFRRYQRKGYFKAISDNKNDHESRNKSKTKNELLQITIRKKLRKIVVKKDLTQSKTDGHEDKGEGNPDNGGTVTVMEVNVYIREAKRQLSDSKNYKILAKDPTITNHNLVNQTIDRFKKEQLINENIANGLKNQSSRTPQFYISTNSERIQPRSSFGKFNKLPRCYYLKICRL